MRQLLAFNLSQDIDRVKAAINGKSTCIPLVYDGTMYVCEVLAIILLIIDLLSKMFAGMYLAKSQELTRQNITYISTEMGTSPDLSVGATTSNFLEMFHV